MAIIDGVICIKTGVVETRRMPNGKMRWRTQKDYRVVVTRWSNEDFDRDDLESETDKELEYIDSTQI